MRISIHPPVFSRLILFAVYFSSTYPQHSARKKNTEWYNIWPADMESSRSNFNEEVLLGFWIFQWMNAFRIRSLCISNSTADRVEFYKDKSGEQRGWMNHDIRTRATVMVIRAKRCCSSLYLIAYYRTFHLLFVFPRNIAVSTNQWS